MNEAGEHPIFLAVAASLTRSPEGSLAFGDDIESIVARAGTISSGDELFELLHQLADFSLFLLEERASPGASAALAAAIQSLLPSLESLALRDGRGATELQARLHDAQRAQRAQAEALDTVRQRTEGLAPASAGLRLRK